MSHSTSHLKENSTRYASLIEKVTGPHMRGSVKIMLKCLNSPLHISLRFLGHMVVYRVLHTESP